MAVKKPRNGGQWTDARFRSFIISALRQATKRWGPRAQAIRDARVERGVYRCAQCGRKMQATEWSVYKSGEKKGKPKKVKHPQMDHVVPVVDPATGFTTWDDYINRMFVEVEGWQALCYQCHEKITAEEREARKKRQ